MFCLHAGWTEGVSFGAEDARMECFGRAAEFVYFIRRRMSAGCIQVLPPVRFCFRINGRVIWERRG